MPLPVNVAIDKQCKHAKLDTTGTVDESFCMLYLLCLLYNNTS